MLNNTNTTWNGLDYDGLNPTIVAIDEMGVEWEAEVTSSGSFYPKLASGTYDFAASEDEYNISVIEDFEDNQYHSN